MVLLSVAFFADTPDELRQETDALQSAAANFNCRFTEMRFQQENCFNTAMPYGLRRVESSHMMLTRSVTALVPLWRRRCSPRRVSSTAETQLPAT